MAAVGRTRILIVDDSAVMRSLLRSVVSADSSLEVAGTAADGASALGSIGLLRPDLILMDVEMPVMDGLLTLKELRRRGHKMPVIMCSALTQRGAKVTLEALAGGASDYVAKPAGQANRDATAIGRYPGQNPVRRGCCQRGRIGHADDLAWGAGGHRQASFRQLRPSRSKRSLASSGPSLPGS